MATILRTWSFRYPWLYDFISKVSSLLIGGENYLRRLPLQGLLLPKNAVVLDLCCGSGLSAQVLADQGYHVTGLDMLAVALKAAVKRVPSGTFVQGHAERLPFDAAQFDLVHTSLALHEMPAQRIKLICQEVQRVLKPGGVFTLLDFHRPTNLLIWPGLALFLALFETSTAWQLLDTDLPQLVREQGFTVQQTCYFGGSLQVIQATKMCVNTDYSKAPAK